MTPITRYHMLYTIQQPNRTAALEPQQPNGACGEGIPTSVEDAARELIEECRAWANPGSSYRLIEVQVQAAQWPEGRSWDATAEVINTALSIWQDGADAGDMPPGLLYDLGGKEAGDALMLAYLQDRSDLSANVGERA